MKITTIGIDLAKTVFQIHGVDGRGNLHSTKDVEMTYVQAQILTYSN